MSGVTAFMTRVARAEERDRHPVVGCRESDALLAPLEDLQGGHDRIVLVVQKTPDDAVPLMGHGLAPGPHRLAQGLEEIDLEALKVVVLVDVVERRVRTLDGDADRQRLNGGDRGNEAAPGQEEQKCPEKVPDRPMQTFSAPDAELPLYRRRLKSQ